MLLVRNLLLCFVLLTSTLAYSDERFPDGPNYEMTPGKLCDSPTEHRYAEQIAYCERNVSSDTKNAVIADYDRKLGYKIRSMPRSDFKIDHFIPLSVGGSNDVENLWPQHKSIYAYSDKIESYVSELMRSGKLKQVDAINAVVNCKLELKRCAEIESDLAKLVRN